jgi:gliding motility-associated-like protein
MFIVFEETLIAQNCPNSNFSQGNFSNWTGTTGSVFTMGSPYDIPGFVAGQHDIISVSTPDPNTGGVITTIPPGGVSSCRLGNDIAGYGAESMTYTINVDMSNRLFVYEYAMILQDPLNTPHSVSERPRFIVKTMDNSGQVIPGNCSYYETYGGDPNNNFTYFTSEITYSNWKKVAIDLSAYVNSPTPIQIQFTTTDCGLGAHWGYAYITTSCGPFEIDMQKDCQGDIVLTAPDGFDSYLWSPGGETTRIITVSNPPTGTYTFSCSMNPIAGLSCPSVVDTTFDFIETPDFSVLDTAICLGETVTLTTICEEVGGTYLWAPTGQTTDNITVTPNATSTYYVSYSALNNCVYTDTATIIVNPLPVIDIPDFYVCIGNEATLQPYPPYYDYVWDDGFFSNVPFIPTIPRYYTVTATDTVTLCQQTDSLFIDIKPLPVAAFTSVCGSIPAQFINNSAGGLIYYWNFGDGSPISVGNNVTHPYLEYDKDSYMVYLTVESVYGCKDSVQNLFILPLLYFVPNTFTPDGDEFNNDFKPIFSRNEKVSSYHFLIYNRWGEIIFETYDLKYGWDGTYNSVMSQDDTYEWELLYEDNVCNNGEKHIFGHVNLIK